MEGNPSVWTTGHLFASPLLLFIFFLIRPFDCAQGRLPKKIKTVLGDSFGPLGRHASRSFSIPSKLVSASPITITTDSPLFCGSAAIGLICCVQFRSWITFRVRGEKWKETREKQILSVCGSCELWGAIDLRFTIYDLCLVVKGEKWVVRFFASLHSLWMTSVRDERWDVRSELWVVSG